MVTGKLSNQQLFNTFETYKTPSYWLDEAISLKRAADIILASHNEDINFLEGLCPPGSNSLEVIELDQTIGSLGSVYMMLAGFVLENLFKGILIYNEPDILGEGKLPSDERYKFIRSHKLRDLLNKIYEQIDIKEVFKQDEYQDLLERLTKYIEWAGRYPVPLNYNRYSENRVANYLSFPHMMGDDPALFQNMYDYFLDVLEKDM